MAITDYASLQSAIGDFLNRADLAAISTTFISLAEAQINRRLVKDGPVREMMTQSPLTVNAELVSVPSDFAGGRAIFLAANYLPLDFVDPEEIVKRKTLYPSQSGNPQVFSVVGGQFQFWPWVGGSFSGTLVYWQRIPPLSVSATTNWLITKHPDIYLYASLIQSAPYLKDDDRVQTWGGLAQAAISDLIGADQVARTAPHLGVSIVPGGTP